MELEVVLPITFIVLSYVMVGLVVTHEIRLSQIDRPKPYYRCRLLIGLLLWPVWGALFFLQQLYRMFAELFGELFNDMTSEASRKDSCND